MDTTQSSYCTLNLARPQVSSKSACNSLPILRTNGFVGTKLLKRFIAGWDDKRGNPVFTKQEAIVFCLSLGTFLLYFMYLREPNDFDEYMSQPIWKRVPGIDPERAEQMMEVDKYLGLQVDYEELEKYKREYYAQKFADYEQEKQEEKRNRKLRQGAYSHHNMLQKYAQKPDVKE
ncbi:uncharacterized protein [Panulirus ornatus]|uniref:uncharacterized protein isoform X2 n=1 Tax=Panulirus ornatus TaxID=150431 RepID=UPI003A865E04